MKKQDRFLIVFLRITGTSAILALIFVAAPYSWMDAIHKYLGLGVLPSEPVVGYLARSTSAFYALIGGLAWVVSYDIHRYRSILIYLGITTIAFGFIIFIVDWAESMPLYWKASEGPTSLILGLLILFLSLRLSKQNGTDSP